MKVYIVTKERFPNGMAATNRIKCYARAIHEGGLDCEVVVCGCTELSSDIRNTEAKGEYEGIPYRYIGGKTTDLRPEKIRRIAQYIRFKKSEWYLKRNLKKGDILFLYIGGRLNETLRLIDLAHKKGAYCVRDLCEYPYATHAETERSIQLRKLTTDKQFPQLDGIVSISEALMDFAKQYTSDNCMHIKVPIMVEFNHYKIEKAKSDIPDVPYIFHAGTIDQQKDGILGVIEAFGMAKQRLNQPLKYILTGDIETSSHPKEIKDLISKYNIADSIEFVGFLYREQVKDYLRGASLVISNRPKTVQDYYGFSTKVGEYLASGTPLILTDWGEAANWLTNGESAYIVEAENTPALADAIVHVFTHQEESTEVGRNGQKTCQQSFDYQNWSKPLVNYLNKVANK